MAKKGRLLAIILLFALGFPFLWAANAASIDTEKSVMTVHVLKAGLFSAFGHLRELPLIERKRSLRRLIPPGCESVLYVDHIEGDGERLFEVVCERDLEGIVAKHRRA